MTQLTSHKASALRGTPQIPGDKSISHRALMFGGLAEGTTRITGLLEGEDVLHTADAMRAMGATIEKSESGTWEASGVGIGNLKQPEKPIEMGNSGTSTRLLIGLVGTHDITVTFKGDESLSGRPMNRVITPLKEMGAKFKATNGDKLPLTIMGAIEAKAIEYTTPIASAQIKSAVLLGGLNANGTTTVIEKTPTRDHTENMLRAFGIKIDTKDEKDGSKIITLKGRQKMTGCNIHVPADPSSAAFAAVAATLVQGSEITLNNICVNPTRIGLYTTLQEMGADIEFLNKRNQGGEPVTDIRVRGNKPLKGITVDPARVASMIDEFPILAMAAACAQGTTIMTDLAELRVKESDRLLMVAQGLQACGVALEMGEDSLTIHGNGKPPQGLKERGALIETALDHRIAMAFLVLGTVTEEPITIDDATPIATSFPNFVALMNALGCNIKEA